MIHHLPMLSQAEAQVQVAAITGLVTILVIIVSALVARYITHPKTPKKDPDEKTAGPLLATYSGDQNEFMHLVIEDSKTIHKRLDDMDAVVETMKKERTQIVGAFGRYILKLANAWGNGGKMPYPDTEDLAILEETLPADWRRKR